MQKQIPGPPYSDETWPEVAVEAHLGRDMVLAEFSVVMAMLVELRRIAEAMDGVECALRDIHAVLEGRL